MNAKVTSDNRSCYGVDGLFPRAPVRRSVRQARRNRPIVVDSCRNRAKSELRKFPFEIISEEF
jgi:hypothetical protein